MTAIQRSKAEIFRSLHQEPGMLVLPNIWDPIGAKLLAGKGFPAVATASAAISAALGFADGERIQLETLLVLLRRIVSSVDLPVSADIEGGFAETVDDLRVTIQQVIETGVVGVNLEDGITEGGALRPMEEQCERIATLRKTADEYNLPLFINARVDCFLSDRIGSEAECLQETVVRAKHYTAAGADCIYPIGPGNRETLVQLRSGISGPLNVLMSPEALPLTVLQDLGIIASVSAPFSSEPVWVGCPV